MEKGIVSGCLIDVYKRQPEYVSGGKNKEPVEGNWIMEEDRRQ